jgi:uncharacterized glyoxalase superfamily protein PhnB
MAALSAYLSYRDAPASIAWLTGIGFSVVARHDGEAGTVAHAELALGEAVVMLASFDADYEIAPLRGRSTGSGLYLVVDDVRDTYDKAIAAGATTVFEPEDTEWGTQRARILDPEGYEWTFGTYRPGQTW